MVLADFRNVLFFDPTPYFCDKFKCSGFLDDIGYLYFDQDHLSEAGSYYFTQKLMKEFDLFRNEQADADQTIED